MSGSSDHAQTGDASAKTDGLKFKVADMTCGHCAQTITKAIQKVSPAAKVHADPVSKLVAVSGAGDLATVKALIAKAGFTPTVS